MLSFIGSILCLIVGIATVAWSFHIQKEEDKERVPGFYTEASIVANKLTKDQTKRKVTFEFTKDFRVLHCTNQYEAEEAALWREGKRFLIVYDEGADKVYCNPMKESRKKQALCMVIGGVVILVGIQWSILAAGLMF